MRALFFPRDNSHLNVFETALFQELMELYLAEPKPMICVKVPRPLEAMTKEIEDYDPSALSQNSIGAFDCALRMDRMMQSLA